MHYGIKGLLLLLLSYFIFTASTCVETIEPSLTSTDFTKEKREILGDLLKETIEAHPEEYALLNRRSKRDSVIISYLQVLYDQATQEIRQDRQSTVSNRWNAERSWQVVILDDDKRYAFSLPGGHFYVSTGFLSTLSKGYEIYYLMAFEATNISGRYLIENLISEYNTSTLLDLIEADEVTAAASLLDIAKTLRDDLAFLSTQEQYRDTRPSYANRLDFIAELGIEGCGTIKSTGLYEKMVLDNL